MSHKCWHHISNINLYFQLKRTPQIFGSIYPIQINSSKIVRSPTLCPKGTQKPSNLHSSPKCRHDISNTNIYIQMIHTPQIFGSIYPIQINSSKIVRSPTLCPKGTQKPSNTHSSPKFWHDISNTNIYIQLTHTTQIVGSIFPIQINISKYSCKRNT